MVSSSSYFLLLLLPALALCHICLINPKQRGATFNPAEAGPGEDICFQPRAPCGKAPVGPPMEKLMGGTTFQLKFQQNLNHYTVGFPGFLDVGWAPGPQNPDQPPSDANFTILAQIPDYWAHQQWIQTNFSVPILVPNIDCEHCVIRIRYHPNKPGEPIFHQCADVRIAQSKTQNFQGRLFASVQQSSQVFISSFAEILPSGQLSYQNTSNVILHQEPPHHLSDNTNTNSASLAKKNKPLKLGKDVYVANGVVGSYLFGANWETGFWNLVGRIGEFQNGLPPDMFSFYSITNPEESIPAFPIPVGDFPANVTLNFVALLPISGQQGTLVVIQIPGVNNTGYIYQVYRIFAACGKGGECGPTTFIFATPPDTTYNDFFWATYDAQRKTIYILSGDGDDPLKLSVKIHSFTIGASAPSSVEIQAPRWTLNHLHVEPSTGALLTVSPGRRGENNFALVATDPHTGIQTVRGPIAGASIFDGLAFGAIVQGVTPAGILHTFRLAESTALVLIDTKTAKILYFTELNLGVNSVARLQNLVYVPTSS